MFKRSVLFSLIMLMVYGSVCAVEHSLLLQQLKSKPDYIPLYAAVLIMRERAQNPKVLQQVKYHQHEAVSRLLRIFAANETPSLCECKGIRDTLAGQLTYKTYPLLFNVVDCMFAHAQNGKLLRKASSRGHGAIVRLLLGCGADVNRRSKTGRTALMVARNKMFGVEKMLRDAGARE